MPSLLVLDDLHLICPSPGDSPAENPNANNSAALVEWLCDVFDSFRPIDKPALPGDRRHMELQFKVAILLHRLSLAWLIMLHVVGNPVSAKSLC